MNRVPALICLLMLASAGCEDRRPIPPTTPAAAPVIVNPLPNPRPNPRPAAGATLGGPSGSYVVTLAASPSCESVRDAVTGEMMPFPDAVRVRQYSGQFADGQAVLTSLSDPAQGAFLGGIDHYLFPTQPLMYISGEELTIISPGDISGRSGTCTDGDYWWEMLSGDFVFFELCGTWRGSLKNPARIAGTIDGGFAYGVGDAQAPRQRLFCSASDHQFSMVRME